MTTTIYLFRHGETDWNKEKRFMGQTQIALNDKGKEQALELAQRVKKLSLVKLYSSDLLRTRQTAEIIATEIGSDIEYDPRFREIDGGLCTGLRIVEMRDKYRSWWQENEKDSYLTQFPEGENFYELVDRVKEGITEISNKYNNQNIGIVTHGGVINSIIIDILGVPQSKRDRVTIDNCGITTISWSKSNPKIISINS